MLVRKNYYLYEENEEKQQEKKKLLGSVRLLRNGEQWAVEIQWKNESEAEKLVSKAEEGELQLQIREKDILLGQREVAGEQKETGNRTEIHREEKKIFKNTEEHRGRELSEDAEADTEENAQEAVEEAVNEDAENTADMNADKIEEQELPVTATESESEEDQQEKEEHKKKTQNQTAGEGRRHQVDQEWELVRRSCRRAESCRELGEVYHVNKGEFALLPESIKHILQNSFLVHGLMNYGYLLLFRADEKTKQFGVGVPGVYYEKEKLVAEMFGFPEFWCDGKSNNGKFGYYLRLVS